MPERGDDIRSIHSHGLTVGHLRQASQPKDVAIRTSGWRPRQPRLDLKRRSTDPKLQ